LKLGFGIDVRVSKIEKVENLIGGLHEEGKV
jgi:hypothetical protein